MKDFIIPIGVLAFFILSIMSVHAYTPSWIIKIDKPLTTEQMVKATDPNRVNDIWVKADVIKISHKKFQPKKPINADKLPFGYWVR